MYMKPVGRCLAVISASMAAGIGLNGESQADVTAAWANATTYTFNIRHVPDFDQRRFLLDNGGNNHCVPTSAMNWMAYFANHGVAWPPGPGNWQSQTRYTDGTNAILDMGILMNTSGASGTGGLDGVNGIRAWLPPYAFVTTNQFMNHTWAPRFQHMSEAVFNGAFVEPIVGWYQEFKFEPDLVIRAGGHALSLNGGARSGGSMEIRWRDPARDEGAIFQRLFEQSPFATEEYAILPVQRTPKMGGVVRPFRTMDKVVGYGSGYLDGYYAIYPMFCLASQPDPEVFLLTKLWGTLLLGGNEGNTELQMEGPIHGIALHGDLQNILYTSDSGLHRFNPTSRDDEVVEADVGEPRAVVVGRKRGVYVVDDTKIVCLNLDVDPPVEEASVFTPDFPGEMAYDDVDDKLLVLAPFDNRIMCYPHDLSEDPMIIPIPGAIVLDDGARIAWDPATGGCWVLSPANDAAYHVMVNEETGGVDVTTLTDDAIVEPTNIKVGDSGRVFIVAGNQIHEFDPVAGVGGAGWERSASPMFAGVDVGDHLLIPRSRSNEDPSLHVVEEWMHVLPEEDLGDPIPDCVSDIDGDGSVGVNDLLALLAAWGPCEGTCYEDVVADEVVNVSDLLRLLADWGPCADS